MINGTPEINPAGRLKMKNTPFSIGKPQPFPIRQTGMVFSAYWHPRSGLLNGV